MDYRAEVYRLRMNRRELAKKMGWGYSTLSGRLNGFTQLQPHEETRLRAFIEEAQKEAKS